MNHIGTRSEDQCMQSACDHTQGLESTLSIINPEVFDNKRAVPFKLRNKLERNAAQGKVPLVLLRVEADRHALSYIRIYDTARPWAQRPGCSSMPPPFCGIERHAGRRCTGAAVPSLYGPGTLAPCVSTIDLVAAKDQARIRKPCGSTSAPALRTAARRSPISSTANPFVSPATALST